MATESMIGRGVYSVAEAARLVRLPESRVRRWVRGYYSTSRGGWLPPLLGFISEYDQVESLSFADLMEVVYLEHFVSSGMKMPKLRKFAERAREALNTRHPFSTHRFVTDGANLLQDLSEELDEPILLNQLSGQLESEAILRQFLRGDVETDSLQRVIRWWPLDRSKDVVLDPTRRFGAPIVARKGIPTSILFASYRAEKSYRKVGAWFNVDWTSVRDAVHFEREIAIAA